MVYASCAMFHHPVSRSILLVLIGGSVLCGASFGALFLHQYGQKEESLAEKLDSAMVDQFLSTTEKEVFRTFLTQHGKEMPPIIPDGTLFEAGVVRTTLTGSTRVIGAIHSEKNGQTTLSTTEAIEKRKGIHPLSTESWYAIAKERSKHTFLFQRMRNVIENEEDALRRAQTIGTKGIVLIDTSATKGTMLWTDVTLPEKTARLVTIKEPSEVMQIQSTEALLSRWTSILQESAPSLLNGIEGRTEYFRQKVALSEEGYRLLGKIPYAYSAGKNSSGALIEAISTSMHPSLIRTLLIPLIETQSPVGTIRETLLPKNQLFQKMILKTEEIAPQEINGWTVYPYGTNVVGIRGTSVALGNSITLFTEERLLEEETSGIASLHGKPETIMKKMEDTFPFLATSERLLWKKMTQINENMRMNIVLSSSFGHVFIEWEVL